MHHFCCIVPTSPANLVVRSVRQNELLVTWDPPTSPHGNVTHYEVYWRKRELVPLKYSRRNYCTDRKYMIISDNYRPVVGVLIIVNIDNVECMIKTNWNYIVVRKL